MYCQNWEISWGGAGREVGPEELAGAMLSLQRAGCHNVNLVSPSHVVAQVIEALVIAAREGLWLPLVYDAGGYDSARGARAPRRRRGRLHAGHEVRRPGDRPVPARPLAPRSAGAPAESPESLPARTRARLTLGRDGDREMLAILELAEPGKDFAVVSEVRLKRAQ